MKHMRGYICGGCGNAYIGGYTSKWCNSCSYPLREIKAKIQTAAIRSVKDAILRGKIKKLDGKIKCVDCGAVATQYDHRDYSKRREVEPVCRSCNVRRGPAKGWEKMLFKNLAMPSDASHPLLETARKQP